MGITAHHAIIVTSWNRDRMPSAREKAIECGCHVSEMATSRVNGSMSFVVWPDGSQEGWDASDEGDVARNTFIAWLNRQRYVDGSTPFAWVEINYGELVQSDGLALDGAKIERHAWQVKTGDGYTGPADLEMGP